MIKNIEDQTGTSNTDKLNSHFNFAHYKNQCLWVTGVFEKAHSTSNDFV